MTSIMIDIETLSTRPDAAILQIGAVQFDRDTGAVSNTFLVSVDKDFYDDNKAFHQDEETIKWWSKQPKAARDALNINKVKTLPLALDRLVEWAEDIGFEESYNFGEDEVWANGQFDLPILSYAFGRMYGDGVMPWKFRQERDLRTVMGELRINTREIELPEACDGLIAHRADHDAIRQAYQLMEIDKL